MTAQNLSYEVFQNIKARIPDNNCSLIDSKDGLNIVDAGVKMAGGWSVARKLLEGLICGLGQVNIGNILLSDFRLPTVELLLDEPVRVFEEAFLDRESINDLVVYGPKSECDTQTYSLGFAVTDKIPVEVPINGNLIVAANTSLVSAVFNASLPVMSAVEALLKAGVPGENILWSWSSCPVATMTDNVEQMMKRNETARSKGAVTSIWLRADSCVIQEVTSSWKFGQLRLHELATAKTYIGGCIDEAGLSQELL
jgi:methenyltetrahydromethanopterin cyclohydrolase